MKLRAEDTAALFIDFQERLVPAIHDNEAIVEKTVILAKGLQEFGVPVAVTQQYTKGLGDTVPAVKEAFADFNYMEKTSFSCCECEEFASWAKALGKKNIIVCGVEAHICVLQKEMGIKRLEKEGAYLTTCEAVLFELTGGAKSPHFKVISKLVK